MREDWEVYKEQRIKEYQNKIDILNEEVKLIDTNYKVDKLSGVEINEELYQKNRKNWTDKIKSEQSYIDDILKETEEESKEQWELEEEWGSWISSV